MSLNADSLRKILELESKKGYTDTAVIGGLDRFLRNWYLQVAEAITTPQLLRRFNRLRLDKSNYGSLTLAQRRELVSHLLDFVAEMEPEETSNGRYCGIR